MNKFLNNLIPSIRQEFILVLFMTAGYSISQMNLSPLQGAVTNGLLLIVMIVWLVKIFIGEEYSKRYKGIIVLIVGGFLFVFGFYSSLRYLLYLLIALPTNAAYYFYLGFPLWVMIEGLLTLLLLNFEHTSKSLNLENKIFTSVPVLSDYVVVAIATVVLLLLGDFIINLDWYLNVSLVLSINIIIINQFAEE